MDNDQLSAAAGQIRSYGAVTVLGAGLSAARFPMTTQLRSLLWHAIDAVPAARDGLAATLGIAGTAKEMIGQDSDAVDSAWRLVERDPAVRTAFQRGLRPPRRGPGALRRPLRSRPARPRRAGRVRSLLQLGHRTRAGQ